MALVIGHAKYRTIAQTLGIAVSPVARDVKASLAELRKERLKDTDAFREMELERLDAIALALWPTRNEPPAARALLGIQERRAKLLGDLSKLTTEELQAAQALVEKATPEASAK